MPDARGRRPRRRRRIALVLVGALVVAGTLTSCDDGEDPVARANPDATLRVGQVGPVSLDPAFADRPSRVSVAQLLFEPLVQPARGWAGVRPGIAASWEVNREQTRIRFRLRRGVQFHDGTPVDAAAVKASLDRVAAPGTGSPLSELLAGVEGFGEVRRGAAAGLAGVRVVDAETLEIALAQPDGSFLSTLGHPGLGIVAPVSAPTVGAVPVGSGPYRFEAEEQGEVGLRRVGAGDTPRRIVVLSFPTAADARAAFDDGLVGTTPLDRSEAVEFTDAARPLGAPYLAVGYYAMNLAAPPLAIPALREAIVRAIDPAVVTRAAYGTTASVLRGLVPEGVPGTTDDVCAGICGPDADRARARLAEAFGTSPPPPVQIDFDEDATQRVVAEAVRDQLAAVGIVATLRPHPVAGYDDFLANGDPQLFRLGWVSAVPVAERFLAPLWGSGSPENVTGFADAAVDAALATARSTGDARQRADALGAAERGVLDDWVVVPVVQFRTRFLVSTRVRGMVVDVLGGLFSQPVSVTDR